MRKEKYVNRIIGDGANGFIVRLPPFSNGIPKKQKYFHINSGEKIIDVQRRAIKFRNNYLKNNGMSHFLNKRMARNFTHHSRNKSGIIGILRAKMTKRGVSSWYWIAKWSTEKGQRSANFNIAIYGEKGAFLWALYRRYQHTGMISIADKTKRKTWPCAVPRKYLKGS